MTSEEKDSEKGRQRSSPSCSRSIKPPTLRHTFASLLIEGGESLKYVQEQLGHHSPAFTLAVYGHLLPRGTRRAVDRLDDADRPQPPAQPRQPKRNR